MPTAMPERCFTSLGIVAVVVVVVSVMFPDAGVLCAVLLQSCSGSAEFRGAWRMLRPCMEA